MAIPKHIVRQNDFSGGQITAAAMRGDDKKIVRCAARQMENWRIRNTGSADSRPGRRALFVSAGRTDEVRLGTTTKFKLCFGDQKLEIRDSADDVIATDSARPWTVATVADIVWTVFGNDIIICYPGMVPRVATWDGSSWSFANYAFSNAAGNEKNAPFYRLPETRGITMTPGSINPGASHTVTFSSSVLTSAHVGSIFRYHGVQLQITGVTNGTTGTATNLGYLPHSITLTVTSSDGFKVGEIIEGATTGTRGEVRGIPSGTSLSVIVLNNRATGFESSEKIVGANTTTTAGGQSAASALATTVWDEQIISNARGWPRSCSTDNSRLIFCDLPGVPEGIIWSAINNAYDLTPGADADAAIFETLADKARVYHVIGGTDEFIFTDRGVKYVSISESSPLAAGNIAFRNVTADAAARIRPVATAEGIVFVGAGEDRLLAIVPTGQIAQPYITRDIAEFHADLIDGPIAIAATTGGGVFPERYIYVANSDGSVAVGRYHSTEEWVGWVPWTGEGKVEWVSALDETLLLTTRYEPASGDVRIVEMLDADAYLDAQVLVNDLPTELEPTGGDGPLWFLAESEVALMDGLLYLGTREVNADGELVPEEGDDFTSPTLVAGMPFQSTLVPFILHAGEGQSVKQSMRRRKIARVAVTTQDSLGYSVDGQRVPRYAPDEDQAEAPEPRSETKFFRKLGRSVDPTVTIVRDVPGPLRITEFGYEVTV